MSKSRARKSAMVLASAVAAGSLGAALSANALGAAVNWRNTATNFNAGPSWSGNSYPGTSNVGVFTASAPAFQPQVTASVGIGGVVFSSNVNGVTLSSNSTSNKLTLVSASTTDGSAALNNNAGAGFTNTISANLEFGATADTTQMVFANSGTLNLDGVISSTNAGSHTLRFYGQGTVALNNSNNSFANKLQVYNHNGKTSFSSLGALGINTSSILIGGTTSTGGNLEYAGSSNIIMSRALEIQPTTGSTSLSVAGAGNWKVNTLNFTGLGDKTFTLKGDGAGLGTLDSAIVNSTGFTTTFAKSGTGTWTLSGTNTYTGTTTINTNGGTLRFAKTGSLYNNDSASWVKAKILVNSGGTFALNVGGTDEFTTGNVTTLLTNLTTTINNNGLMAGSSIGFDTTNAADGTFTVAGNIVNSTGTGSGAVGVVKLGTNSLILNGVANTYSGPTSVKAGTLLVNGTNSGTGAVTVAGGTLGGTGSIAGTVTVNAGAVLAPGASIEDLNVASADIDGTLKIELNDANGTMKVDKLIVTGALDITNTTLDFDVTGTPGQTAYVFASYGAGQLTGTFAPANVIDKPTGYSIDYNYQGGNQIAIVVPEPGTLGLLSLAGPAILLRRRRRNRNGDE